MVQVERVRRLVWVLGLELGALERLLAGDIVELSDVDWLIVADVVLSEGLRGWC